MKENGFTLKKQKIDETITDADYVDDLVLLANTSVESESLLHDLEQTERGIGLLVNSDKTEFMYFNQNGAISSFNGKPLKLVDHFMYRGSNILSTESDVSIRIGKA